MFTGNTFAKDDKTYTIPFENIHLYIQENGSLHIVETLHYSFSGTYNGVERNIPMKSGKIENLKVSTEGAYSKFNTSNIQEEYGEQKCITVYLYSNPQKTNPITNQDIEVTYEYDFIKCINIYNDGATLHYTLFGKDWKVDLGKLNAFIHLNNKDVIKYWLNPPNLVSNCNWKENTIEISTNKIKSRNLFELRMILPKNYFTNPIYASINQKNGVLEFENLQKQYEDGTQLFTNLYTILSIIMVLIAIIPLFIYFKFGKEPKISYQGDYEYKPPTNDSPAIVNALYEGHIGSVNMNGFKATVLNLINKKYIEMENFDEKYCTSKGTNPSKNPFIILNNDLSKIELKESEKMAFDILKLFADNESKLDLVKFKKDIEKDLHSKKFREQYTTYSKYVEYESNKNIENLFILKGYRIAIIFGISGIILSGAVLLLLLSNTLPFVFVEPVNTLIFTLILLLIVSIIAIILPNKVFGHWTQEGKEREEKWNNFKKYLNDLALIKEVPLSSIALWNEYLVYGTALGLAENVLKSMEEIIPKEALNSIDNYIFYNYGGTYLLFSSFDSGVSTANSSDSSGSGGSGGFGGGFGGGGGGAF
jgi:uncharacterized membrane protein